MSKLPKHRFHLVFSLIMGTTMVVIMTFIITLANVGLVPDFLSRWLHAIAIAWVIAVPLLFFLAPRVRAITARFVELP